MRIAKPTVWCVTVVSLAMGTALAQDNGLNLDDLLSGIEDSAPPAVAEETSAQASGVLDDLLGGLEEEAVNHADAAEHATSEAAEDLEVDLTDLLDEDLVDADAVAEPSGGMGAMVATEDVVAEIAGDAEITDAAAVAEIVTEEAEAEKQPLSDDALAEIAAEVSAAEAARLSARKLEGLDRVEEGFEALEKKDYESADHLLEEALRLIPETASTEATLESVRWGLSEANTKLGDAYLKDKEYDAASKAYEDAVTYNPDNRSARRRLDSLQSQIRADGSKPVALRPETVSRAKRIKLLLLEGRDLFENGFYDESEAAFNQVRDIDGYNEEAMRFIDRIHERRLELLALQRNMTVSDMIQQVRRKWTPPLPLELEKPDLGDDKPPEIGTGDVEEDKLMQQMKELIIPSIEFSNANIMDVIEELRRESERADEEGIGINIVLKLTGAATPVIPQDPLGTDTGFEDFGTLDEFGPTSRAPSGRMPGSDFSFPGDEFSTDFGNSFNSAGSATIDPNATVAQIPRITLTLRQISLYDALRIITEYADLKFKLDKRIVFITPVNTITEPLETRVYSVQPSLIENVVTRSEGQQQGGSQRQSSGSGEFIELGTQIDVVRIDVRQFFLEAGVPFPPGTSIAYNDASSQLIVRNTLENLEIFERILPNFNIPPTQVEIEARFVEILQEDLESLGVEWILTDDWELARNTETSILGGQERVQINSDDTGFTSGTRNFQMGPTGIEPNIRSGLDDIGFFGDILSFSSVLTNPEMTVVLHALHQRGGTDLLSAPRITTRSGNTASIEVVQEIIYPTEFEAESATSRIDVDADEANIDIPNGVVIFPEQFDTREVGVILNVTPTVGPDKYTIDLTIAPEVAELVDWIQYGTPPFNIPQPIFSSRNAQTSILIWDGQTVVMGGLINEALTRYEDKVPFLGDLPFIGRLFRTEGEASRKRNLLIFVTARIVDPAGQPLNKKRAVATAVLGNDGGMSVGAR